MARITSDDETPELIVFTADWHVNDTKGLCPPKFQREDESTHRPGAAILGMRRDWLTLWEWAEEKKREAGARLIAVFDGDLGDMNKHSKQQLISMRKQDVLLAMADVAEPAIAVADHVFVIRGTAAHSGGSGELEELFAKDIRGGKCVHNGKDASWWVLEATFGGVDGDVYHHPPTNTRLPNKYNQAAARGAERVAISYLRQGLKPPRFVVWGHVHHNGHGSELGVHGFYLPPWKMVGEFGYRIGVGANVEPWGALWMLCQGGEIREWDYIFYKVRRGKRWTYNQK